MARLHPLLASSLAWTVGAATAAGVGLLALSLIRSGLTEEAFQPLAPGAVGQAVAESTPPASAPVSVAPPTSSPSPAAAATERQVTSSGGTVLARCGDGQAYLVYWTPEPGFKAEDVIRGPAPTARVTFEAPGREVKVSIVCVGGVPQPSVDQDWGDNGGHE